MQCAKVLGRLFDRDVRRPCASTLGRLLRAGQGRVIVLLGVCVFYVLDVVGRTGLGMSCAVLRFAVLLHRVFEARSQNCEKRPLASSCLSVGPSVNMQHLCSHWTNFREI